MCDLSSNQCIFCTGLQATLHACRRGAGHATRSLGIGPTARAQRHRAIHQLINELVQTVWPFPFRAFLLTLIPLIKTGSLWVLCARKRTLATSVPQGIKQSQHVEDVSLCILHDAARCCAMRLQAPLSTCTPSSWTWRPRKILPQNSKPWLIHLQGLSHMCC